MKIREVDGGFVSCDAPGGKLTRESLRSEFAEIMGEFEEMIPCHCTRTKQCKCCAVAERLYRFSGEL